MTIVIVTHDTNTVASFCNKAIWINGGQVMASGKARLVVDQYLQFMNQKLYESMQRRKEQESETEPRSARTGETEEDDGRELTPQDFDRTAKRFGLRYAEIVEARFVNQSGEKVFALRQGENACLEMIYHVNRPVASGYTFGIGIYTMDYECVYGVNTKLDGHDITDLPQDGKVVFSMEDFPLLAGKYILEVAIEDANSIPMDYIRDYMRFDVISNERAIGTTLIRHSWTIE